MHSVISALKMSRIKDFRLLDSYHLSSCRLWSWWGGEKWHDHFSRSLRIRAWCGTYTSGTFYSQLHPPGPYLEWAGIKLATPEPQWKERAQATEKSRQSRRWWRLFSYTFRVDEPPGRRRYRSQSLNIKSFSDSEGPFDDCLACLLFCLWALCVMFDFLFTFS